MIKVFLDKRLYIGTAILIVAGVLTIFILDRYIMPVYTNFNSGVTVPDVTKLHIDDAMLKLQSIGLRYEVIDSRSNENFPPDFVLDQTPAKHALVKPNRKIYLTTNTSAVPMVEVPNVMNMSLRNAEIQLRNFGLELGFISYASSRFENSVLNQSVPAGTSVRRGTAVNLVVSDGLGMNRVEVPNVIGMRLAEAQRELRSKGLRIGEIRFQRTAEIEPNIIISFTPLDADSLFEGESVDLIVSELLRVEEAEERGAVIIDSTEVNTTPPPPNNED